MLLRKFKPRWNKPPNKQNKTPPNAVRVHFSVESAHTRNVLNAFGWPEKEHLLFFCIAEVQIQRNWWAATCNRFYILA